MKFHKQFLSALQLLHDETLIQHSIPYKFWKKYIKNNKEHLDTNRIIPILEDQCSTVDTIFRKEMEEIIHPKKRCRLSWCNHKTYSMIPLEYRKRDLLLYTELNNTAFFKVCKKLEKNGATNLMNYFAQKKASHDYEFLNGPQKVFLSLLEKPEYECPICLEQEMPVVILNCGHTLCYGCFESIAGIRNIKGTLYNRISIANTRLQCPICRKKAPLESVHEWNFYPTMSLTKMN